jgi:hypothetical protein
LIYDALATNPDRLSSNNVFEWLQANRSHTYQEGEEEDFKAYVRKALSAHSRKATPTVSKVDSSGGSHFIWKLAGAEGQLPRSCDLTDRSPPSAEGTPEGIRTLVSPQDDLRRAGTRITTPTAEQGYDNKSNGQPQKPEAGSGEACGEEEGTENVVSVTNHSTGNSTHQPPRMSSEPSTTTSPKSLVVVQPRTYAPDEIGVEAVITIPSPKALDIGEPRKTRNESDEASNPDPETLRHYGMLVFDLNRMKTRRDLCKQNIAVDRNTLPDIKDKDKDVEQAMQKVAELTRMLEKAHKIAAAACSAREATITKMDEIETAKLELEQLVAEHEVLRTELDNYVD